MAEIAYTVTKLQEDLLKVTWDGVGNGDTFQEYEIGELPLEISAHVAGTLDGATVTVKGGHVTGGAGQLTRLDGANASATAEIVMSIAERPLFITPSHSGGGGSEDIDIHVVIQK